MKCVENGHEIVALANLYPRSGEEELDSYMYQSVGHDAINAISECLELPLYRKEIKGKPVNLNYEYESTSDDEVEDLYELLKEVLAVHSDIKGVSSGAIFSNYQKNRVEQVCSRLNLISLAYLWEREQQSLLDEMISSNLHAILIKTAVIGLGPIDLGKSLIEMRDKLFKLSQKYQINVCGEGGEFESLTLDCPLFKNKKLKILETDTIVHRCDDLAPVVFLKIKRIEIIPK